jgi:hypothetical protein
VDGQPWLALPQPDRFSSAPEPAPGA